MGSLLLAAKGSAAAPAGSWFGSITLSSSEANLGGRLLAVVLAVDRAPVLGVAASGASEPAEAARGSGGGPVGRGGASSAGKGSACVGSAACGSVGACGGGGGGGAVDGRGPLVDEVRSSCAAEAEAPAPEERLSLGSHSTAHHASASPGV